MSCHLKVTVCTEQTDQVTGNDKVISNKTKALRLLKQTAALYPFSFIDTKHPILNYTPSLQQFCQQIQQLTL